MIKKQCQTTELKHFQTPTPHPPSSATFSNGPVAYFMLFYFRLFLVMLPSTGQQLTMLLSKQVDDRLSRKQTRWCNRRKPLTCIFPRKPNREESIHLLHRLHLSVSYFDLFVLFCFVFVTRGAAYHPHDELSHDLLRIRPAAFSYAKTYSCPVTKIHTPPEKSCKLLIRVKLQDMCFNYTQITDLRLFFCHSLIFYPLFQH